MDDYYPNPNLPHPVRIFKYSLEPDRRQLVQLPSDAKVIHVAEQYGALVMWAEVGVGDDRKPIWPIKPRVFVVVTTGDVFNATGKTYLGSATLGKQGSEWFVAHVYEQQQGHTDPIDGRVPEDWAQLKAELAG